MEDGENGAKRRWNGYIREKTMIFYGDFPKKMKKCLKWVVRRANIFLTSAICIIFRDLAI